MALVKPPELADDESVVMEFRATRSQGVRAVGGKMWVTTSHLRFRPHALDSATGGHGFDCERGQIAAVDVAPRSFSHSPFSGALKRRLRIRLVNGREELFVVTKVRTKADQMSALVRRV